MLYVSNKETESIKRDWNELIGEIEQTTLKGMIRKTIFAISQEENRPIFTGCLFEVINKVVKYKMLYIFRRNEKKMKFLAKDK